MQPVAYQDREFLDSDEARPLRILAEYLEPLRRFQAQNVQDTVVFFGSARVNSREHADTELADLVRRNIISPAEARAKAKIPENFPG